MKHSVFKLLRGILLALPCRVTAKRAGCLLIAIPFFIVTLNADETPALHAGFAAADITPKLGNQPVYIAGFGHNRKATAVHDPILARAAVLRHGKEKIALVSVDLVGFFHGQVEKIRAQLPGFSYVLVSSTHNHEGPDTLGLWGSSPFASGVDPAYLKLVEEKIIEIVRQADQTARPVTAQIGSAKAPELLHDNREPFLKHDELIALEFVNVGTKKPAGIIVQWNCHPETLDSKNTQLSADFVGYTVKELQERRKCPVVYLTGTVGGLMTSLKVPIKDEQGKELADGTFEKTERYGRLVGKAADQALSKAKPIQLTPLQAKSKAVYVPLDNKLYVLGWRLGVLQRQAYLWTGDSYAAKPAEVSDAAKPLCLRTEVAWLRLGELDVACVPGEIYPELVLDKVQDPADPAADFPDAPIEPAVYKQLPGPYRLIVGLANDEIGYIIPKRQWDEKTPYCYGRQKAQYGEMNSCGPETAPVLLKAFRELGKKN